MILSSRICDLNPVFNRNQIVKTKVLSSIGIVISEVPQRSVLSTVFFVFCINDWLFQIGVHYSIMMLPLLAGSEYTESGQISEW